MKLKLQFHSAYLIWLPSGVDDGYQLTQKQAALGSLVMSWPGTTRDLAGYVLARNWKARIQWFVKKMHHVNAIHHANCDMISCQFIINQTCEFKTPASLYDYTCVAILKKSIYYNKYLIRGPETSWFLAPFSMDEGLLSGYAMSDAKKEVYLISFWVTIYSLVFC